jgi:hypothetical protein
VNGDIRIASSNASTRWIERGVIPMAGMDWGAIARRAVELQGGVITARGAPGFGAEFVVDLPLTPHGTVRTPERR